MPRWQSSGIVSHTKNMLLLLIAKTVTVEISLRSQTLQDVLSLSVPRYSMKAYTNIMAMIYCRLKAGNGLALLTLRKRSTLKPSFTALQVIVRKAATQGNHQHHHRRRCHHAITNAVHILLFDTQTCCRTPPLLPEAIHIHPSR
eukprot:2558699-Amphidinium_carterae.1